MSAIRFIPQSSSYAIDNALALVRCAALAYESAASLGQALQVAGFRSHYIEHRDTQLFVAASPTDIVVAFRGTTSIRDWMTDAEVAPVAGPAGIGRVHGGFAHALGLVWADLLAAVRAEQTTAQALWLTGHSLGGALALLAGARCAFELDKPVRGIYTYGQPRVGDREFARSCNGEFGQRVFRFVNNSDIVSRLPPRQIEFSHCGQLRFIDAEQKIHNDISYWQEFLEGVQGSFEQHLDAVPSFAENHFVQNYVAAIEKNAGQP